MIAKCAWCKSIAAFECDHCGLPLCGAGVLDCADSDYDPEEGSSVRCKQCVKLLELVWWLKAVDWSWDPGRNTDAIHRAIDSAREVLDR